MSGQTSPAGALHRPISAASSSLLDRVEPKSQSLGTLSETQAKVDALVSHSVTEATNLKTLTAMAAGGFAFRLTRIGTFTPLSSFLGRSQTILPWLARGGSYATALGAESFVFAGVGRELNRLEGHAPVRPFVQEWVQAALTLGALKSAGHLARGENILLQHLAADLGMVGGHQLGHALGVTEKPQGTFAEQMLGAEALNWSMKGGMSLLHGLFPRLTSSEKFLDFYLQSSAENPLSRQSSFPILPETALAAEGVGLISAEPLKAERLAGVSLSVGKGGGKAKADPSSQLRQALVRAGWDAEHADSFLSGLQTQKAPLREMVPLVEKMGEMDWSPVKQSQTLQLLRTKSERSLKATLEGFTQLLTALKDSSWNKKTQAYLIDHLLLHGGKTLSITFRNFISFAQALNAQNWPAEAQEKMASLVMHEQQDLSPLLKNLPLVTKAMGEGGWSFTQQVEHLNGLGARFEAIDRSDQFSLNSVVQPEVAVLREMQANHWPALEQRGLLENLADREINRFLGTNIRNLGHVLKMTRESGWTGTQQQEVLRMAVEEVLDTSRAGTNLKTLPSLLKTLDEEGFEGESQYSFLKLHFQTRGLIFLSKESPLSDPSFPLDRILVEHRQLTFSETTAAQAFHDVKTLAQLAPEVLPEALPIYRSLVLGADPMEILHYEKESPQKREAGALATFFYLTRQPAELREKVVDELKNQIRKGEGRASLSAAEILGYFSREGLLHPGQEGVWKDLGLRNIEFRDQGNGFSAIPSFMAGFLPEKMGKTSPLVEKYLLKEDDFTLKSFENLEALDDFLKSQGADVASRRVLGRSSLYSLAEGDGVLVLKCAEPQGRIKRLLELNAPEPILLNRLSTTPLANEVRWLAVLAEANLALKSALPKPLRDPDGKLLIFQFEDGRHAVAFKAEENYYRYLDDPRLGEGEFFEGLEKSVHDAFLLARHQALHTAPIRLFHNAEAGADKRPTGDRGHFVVSPDIVFQFDTRYGMGRLNDWPGALKYGNFGVSGLRDFEELSYSYYGSPRRGQPLSNRDLAPELKGLGWRSNRRALTEALILGNSLLGATLFIGNRLAEEAKGLSGPLRPWQHDAFLGRHAVRLQSIFSMAYSAYHEVPFDKAKETIGPRADWVRFARQLAFFMTPDYAEYLAEGTSTDRFPTAKIYGPHVDIPQKNFGPYRRLTPFHPNRALSAIFEKPFYTQTFHPKKGFVGPDGNPDALSLGPVNGQFPIREFEPAFWGIFW